MVEGTIIARFIFKHFRRFAAVRHTHTACGRHKHLPAASIMVKHETDLVFRVVAAGDERCPGGVTPDRVGVTILDVGVAGTRNGGKQHHGIQAAPGNHGTCGKQAGDESGTVFVHIHAVHIARQTELPVNDFTVAGNGVIPCS